MTTTGNFTSGFSIESGCQKPVVECANGDCVTIDHSDGRRHLPVAKHLNLNHVAMGILPTVINAMTLFQH